MKRPQKIVLASNNSSKYKELQDLLSPFNCAVYPQSTFNIESIDETGLTFVENALLKARHAAVESQMPTLADDSGLCVDILQGAPGLYSARYAGKHASSESHIHKLLKSLHKVPYEKRQAHFHCTLVYLEHAQDPDPIICQGRWAGYISLTPTGSKGFGYDPIFFVPEYACVAAELSFKVKNTISHRAQAISQLKHLLYCLYK
ncbi:MAG: RdgB/HAM1 family non-canonical purine NTP pyrophosphatase [Endozoicomonadaceae bacterium]|nr:RdgB/HAM1 family non-canonical purine NTP pyrophosphatase [Endozoicomonadaceae bacterium]MBE8232693.1 RdgB/HAM1 family non-canonical purine NTP pyrophosphatase [Endozoicomonadaceae bacterium]